MFWRMFSELRPARLMFWAQTGRSDHAAEAPTPPLAADDPAPPPAADELRVLGGAHGCSGRLIGGGCHDSGAVHARKP